MASDTNRPNIIFIHTDSMDGRIMGCMGHPAMGRATPNIDALAQQGVMFRNAYSNNPVCCPSRASMWSGQYTHHCEGWNNHKGLEKDTPTFQTHLEREGYAMHILGKTDYLSGFHTIRARVSPWTRAAAIHKPAYRMDAPKIIEENEARVHKYDWTIIDKGITWLKENTSGNNKPFMLYLSVNAPHPEFITSRRYLDMIDEAGVTLPDNDETYHPVLEYQRVHKNWMHGFSDEMVRKVRKIYFAMIAEVDAMVGKVMEAVKELGLNDSAYIIFTSDHGELAMEHQQFYKMSPYEPSVRVPLIITGPGVQHGVTVEDLVSLVDIYPTLMGMAGLLTPKGLDGHSLIPELTGNSSDRPDWVLSEFHGTTIQTGTFMLRRGDWKYIVFVGYEPMLFNLKDDPGEVCDRAKERPEIVKEMDALLMGIVDYEAVDAKVKEYDKQSFRQWKEEQMAAGTYEHSMAQVYSGWDYLENETGLTWSNEDEAQIQKWLES